MTNNQGLDELDKILNNFYAIRSKVISGGTPRQLVAAKSYTKAALQTYINKQIIEELEKLKFYGHSNQVKNGLVLSERYYRNRIAELKRMK